MENNVKHRIKTQSKYSAIFVYRNVAKDKIQIGETSEKEKISDTQEPGKAIQLQNREVYYDSEETTSEPTVHFMENEVLVKIKGNLDRDELLQIAGQMKPSK